MTEAFMQNMMKMFAQQMFQMQMQMQQPPSHQMPPP
jgi:hypothetical protein